MILKWHGQDQQGEIKHDVADAVSQGDDSPVKTLCVVNWVIPRCLDRMALKYEDKKGRKPPEKGHSAREPQPSCEGPTSGEDSAVQNQDGVFDEHDAPKVSARQNDIAL